MVRFQKITFTNRGCVLLRTVKLWHPAKPNKLIKRCRNTIGKLHDDPHSNNHQFVSIYLQSQILVARGVNSGVVRNLFWEV